MIDEIRLTVGGTAAGTAVDLAKLGAKVVAMGAIGDGELGLADLDSEAIERPDMLEMLEPCLPYVDYFMPGPDEARMIMETAETYPLDTEA